MLDNDFEILAFPDLFPYGSGAYNSEERSVKLPIHKYFQQRLLNVDIRFAQNIEYLFCAQHIVNLKHLQSESTLTLRLSRGRTLGGNKINAGVLRNPEALKQLIRNQEAYKFLKNICGSPAYWQMSCMMYWQCYVLWVFLHGFSLCLQQICTGQR